mgnify:CR=1 FL=1
MLKDEYGLTLKQRTFADEYLLTHNKKASAIKAGVSAKSAGTTGGRLCKNVDVSKYISLRRCQIQDELEASYCTTKDRLLRELAAIAFLDPAKMFDESGNILPMHTMDEMTRRAIASIDVEELANTDSELIGCVRKVKTSSKIAAIELLGRHLGMWGQNNDGERSILNIRIITDKNQLDHPDYLSTLKNGAK